MMKRYTCWLEDDESTANAVRAMSPGEAAELWAEIRDWNTAEFAIAKADGTIIVVRQDSNGSTCRLNVTAESRPVYSAASA